MNDNSIVEEIRALEKKRCVALVAADLATLDELVAEDLVHIHTTGASEDKATYMKGIEKRLRFISVERGDIHVRVYGDSAVSTGRIDQTVVIQATNREIVMKAITTQVWVRSKGRWRQSSFHATLLA